ncbi:MAG: tyrosine-type recombinase/integrase [Candidatus Brocadiales bacterium]|nr:tyrosine-type recombinase/integrase [Candidatus Brocadiales bacterium]
MDSDVIEVDGNYGIVNRYGERSPCLPTHLETIFKAFLVNFESKATMKEYALAAKEFFMLVGPHIQDVGELKREHIIFYKTKLKKRGLAHKTILKKLSAISSLCKYLAHEGLVDKDITYGVKRPKDYNKKETKAFTEIEVRKIFESMNPDAFAYLSHRAILAVGFYTGLRSSEMRNLKIENYCKVDGHKVLKTTIKGDKPHEIPLNPFAVKCIDEHLEKLRDWDLGIAPGDYLFPRVRPLANKPISAKGLRKILHDKLKLAGIAISGVRRYSPHSMRATLATHLLNKVEAPLEDVQKLLGHSTPATTQKYNKRDKGHGKSPVYKIDY